MNLKLSNSAVPTRKRSRAVPHVIHSREDKRQPAKSSGIHRPLPPQIGGKLRELRLRKTMTLGDVEAKSGISKSMLSQIERGKVNPTFARVWHLTRSLGIGVGELLGEVSTRFEAFREYEHLKVFRTPSITSPDGLCTTKILNPMRYGAPFEWYEMAFKCGGSLRANAHGCGAWEHMTCVVGRVVVEIGEHEVTLDVGETVRYSAEQAHGTRNIFNGESKVFLVVIATKEMSLADLALIRGS